VGTPRDRGGAAAGPGSAAPVPRASNWLRNIEFEASLDYLATGLPRRGDVIDGQLYLEDARGWSVSFLLVMPLASLVPQ